MTLDEITTRAIVPAMALLPARMDSARARVQLLAIALQESELIYRRQMGNGPARGFWQFEQGGGVRGCVNHPASASYLRQLCVTRGVAFDARAIWNAIEHDDVLAAGLARLLLWTDPRPLPALGDAQAAWECYAWNWRPGKPHPDKWPANYAQALEFVR